MLMLMATNAYALGRRS